MPEKWRKAEEDRMNKEKFATEEYVRKERDVLRLEKDLFAANMKHDQSLLLEKAQIEYDQLLRGFESSIMDLERNLQKRLRDFQDKEKAFEEEKAREFSNISHLKEVLSELEAVRSEKVRLVKGKQDNELFREELVDNQLGMQKNIDELGLLSKKLEDQREDLIHQRSQFFSFVEELKICPPGNQHLTSRNLDSALSDQPVVLEDDIEPSMAAAAERSSLDSHREEPVFEIFDNSEDDKPLEVVGLQQAVWGNNHKRTCKISMGAVHRTRSVKAVVEDAVSFLVDTSAISLANEGQVKNAPIINEGSMWEPSLPAKVPRKRTRARTSIITGVNEPEADDTESLTESRRKKRWPNATVSTPKAEEKRYNLRLLEVGKAAAAVDLPEKTEFGVNSGAAFGPLETDYDDVKPMRLTVMDVHIDA